MKPIKRQNNLPCPKVIRVCWSGKFLMLILSGFKKAVKPIYSLSRKGRFFHWEQEQQKAFEEIKTRRLQKPPVFHMPNNRGRFHLYSDTSTFFPGRTLYQIHNVQPRLIAYASKRTPSAAQNYSITELELCELVINIVSFSHLQKGLTLILS